MLSPRSISDFFYVWEKPPDLRRRLPWCTTNCGFIFAAEIYTWLWPPNPLRQPGFPSSAYWSTSPDFPFPWRRRKKMKAWAGSWWKKWQTLVYRDGEGILQLRLVRIPSRLLVCPPNQGNWEHSSCLHFPYSLPMPPGIHALPSQGCPEWQSSWYRWLLNTRLAWMLFHMGRAPPGTYCDIFVLMEHQPFRFLTMMVTGLWSIFPTWAP